MHEYLAPAMLPTAVLAGIWLNQRATGTLRDEMRDKFQNAEKNSDRRFDELYHRIDELSRRTGLLEDDYKQFYGLQSKLEGRVDEISRR